MSGARLPSREVAIRYVREQGGAALLAVTAPLMFDSPEDFVYNQNASRSLKKYSSLHKQT